MNRWALNSQTIGNGEPSFRVFLSVSGIAAATSSAVIIAKRYMTAVITGRASSASRLDGLYRLSSAITARATSSITTTKYLAKYLASSVRAKATSTVVWFAQRSLSAVMTAAGSSNSILYRGRLLDAAVIAQATSDAEILELATDAPIERRIIIPYENRSVEVI